MEIETVKSNMGSYLNSSKERLDIIMSIASDYFAGKDRKTLELRFKEGLGNKISAGEFALSEQLVEEKGVSDHKFEMEVDGLLEIFKPGLIQEKITGLPEGHPLDSFIRENIAIQKLIEELREAQKTVDLNKVDAKFWKESYDKIWQIDTHYIRKENQLFPYLEKKHFLKPSKVMWTMHDKIRAIIKNNRTLLEEQKYEELFKNQGKMFAAIESMMFKEEKILWETSLELLTDEEWMDIRNGEAEVGYCLIEQPKEWKI